jgi:multidrug efflux pump subunit AcrB
VNWCVQHRWITIGAHLATFALGIAGMGPVQQQFFPDSSRPEILVDLWLPEGSTVQQPSEEVAKRFEKRLMREPAWLGQHLGGQRRAALLPAAGPDLSRSPTSASHRAAQGPEAREALRVRLPALLAQEFPEVRGRVKLLPNGPPVPYPVQFRVVGRDPQVLRQLGRRGQGRAARQAQHARRERQLERIDQGAAPGQSTRTRRARWASPASPSRRRRAPSCRAPRSASTARATS